jgi:hypothetical protein
MQLFDFIKYFILALALSYTVAAPAAEDWLVLNPQEKNVFIAIEQSSVVRQGEKALFWERVEFEQPIEKDEVSGRMIKYKRVQRVMDCAARTQGVLRGSSFGENHKLIEAIIFEAEKVEMSPVAPGTIAQMQFEIACKQSKN